MELGLIWTMAQRELREALRHRWLWFYALAFAGLALALSQAGLASAGYAGLGGFGRTSASLINALLLFAPLMGLSVGAGAVAGDRERGTLLYLLAQPVSRTEVFFGKAIGAAMALVAALGLGFGLAGLGLASGGDGNAVAYLTLAGYTLLLALIALGLGLIISTLTRKASTAAGAALVLWLGLVFFGDLGLVGATLAWRPTPDVLFMMLIANPLQVFKLASIYSLRATLDTLGAVGQFALFQFGSGLPVVFFALLAGWIVATFGIAFILFSRKGDA
jgi:Cu-processing system permease protein